MLKTDIGFLIKTRRKELKINQAILAELAGISVNTLYKIEREQANPTIDVLEKILEVLGMEIIIKVKSQD